MQLSIYTLQHLSQLLAPTAATSSTCRTSASCAIGVIADLTSWSCSAVPRYSGLAGSRLPAAAGPSESVEQRNMFGGKSGCAGDAGLRRMRDILRFLCSLWLPTPSDIGVEGS